MFPFFTVSFWCFFGLIPEFRKKAGNRPGKKRTHFPEKERNLLSFEVRIYIPALKTKFYDITLKKKQWTF